MKRNNNFYHILVGDSCNKFHTQLRAIIINLLHVANIIITKKKCIFNEPFSYCNDICVHCKKNCKYLSFYRPYRKA